nr:hypothetical protein [Mucilaginibacter sp. L294]
MMPAEIMQHIAQVCGVTVEQMQNQTRKQEVVFARWITVKMLLDGKVSPMRILDLFPNHTRPTILNYSNNVFEDMLKHKPFKTLYAACEAALKPL